MYRRQHQEHCTYTTNQHTITLSQEMGSFKIMAENIIVIMGTVVEMMEALMEEVLAKP